MPAAAATDLLSKSPRVAAGNEALVRAEFNRTMGAQRAQLSEAALSNSSSSGNDSASAEEAQDQADDAAADDEAEAEEEAVFDQAKTANLIRLARQLKKKEQAGLSNAASQVAEQATSAATSELLQKYWIALPETFGLSIILVDIHIFMWLTVGKKYFCALGSEWSSGLAGKNIGIGASGSRPAFLGASEGEAAILEWIIVLVLNLIIGFILFIDIMFIGLTCYAIVHPIEATWTLMKFWFSDAITN